MQTVAKKWHTENKTIGLVPTMGALHTAHLSLLRKAKIDNDFVVLSIFVNPTQFEPSEDYHIYPRDLARDLEIIDGVGIDIIFIPEAADMYPSGFKTTVEVKELSTRLCGAVRPNHFQGVTTVVTKLFNIIKPTRAYFGQKDAQQAIIIKRMAVDLHMEVEIVVLPTIREEDGVAYSSRNLYLSPKERQAAQVIPRSLELAKAKIMQGERVASRIKQQIQDVIQSEPLAQLEYISICEPESLSELEIINEGTLIALAVRIGKARLIDNITAEELS